MSTAETDQVSEVLGRVKGWSAPSRMALAMGILESFADPGGDEIGPAPPANGPTRGVPDDVAVGLLGIDRNPPDDERCRQIVEEERWKKYAPPAS